MSKIESMNKTIIYFLRHGEVENPKKILYGRLPGFGLSEKGKESIKEVAQEFKKKNIDYLYNSPLRRARETVDILINVLKIEPKISRLLIETKEIHAGISLEIFKRDIQPNLYDDRYVNKGQESIDSQAGRMMRFVKNVQKQYAGKIILAVSHGDPIMILKAKVLGVPFTWEFKRSVYLQPGSYITLVCQDNKYRFE